MSSKYQTWSCRPCLSRLPIPLKTNPSGEPCTEIVWPVIRPSPRLPPIHRRSAQWWRRGHSYQLTCAYLPPVRYAANLWVIGLRICLHLRRNAELTIISLLSAICHKAMVCHELFQPLAPPLAIGWRHSLFNRINQAGECHPKVSLTEIIRPQGFHQAVELCKFILKLGASRVHELCSLRSSALGVVRHPHLHSISAHQDLAPEPQITCPDRRLHGEYRVNTKSRPLTGTWQAKQTFASMCAGFPSLNCTNPQPSVDANRFESLTMNWTLVASPATYD